MATGRKASVYRLLQSCVTTPIRGSGFQESDDDDDDDEEVDETVTHSENYINQSQKFSFESNSKDLEWNSTDVSHKKRGKHLGTTQRLQYQSSNSAGQDDRQHNNCPEASTSYESKRKESYSKVSDGSFKRNNKCVHPNKRIRLQNSDLYENNVIEDERSQHGEKNTAEDPWYGSSEFESKHYGGGKKMIEVRNKEKRISKGTSKRKSKSKKISSESNSGEESNEPQVVENSQTSTKKTRNTRFSLDENLALIENIMPVYDKLVGKYLNNTDSGWRMRTWAKIAEAVNSVSLLKRNVDSIRKRYQDIKADVREKMRQEVKESKKTGGLGIDIYFKPYEKLLKQMIDKDSIVGIKNSFDPSRHGKSSNPASITVTTEKCPPQEDLETSMLINEKQDLQESMVDRSTIQVEDNAEEVILTLVPENNTETPLQATDNYVLPAIPNTQRNTSVSNVSTPDDINSNAVPVHISRSRQSICRTRNLDKEQYLFDRQQSERIHETQQQYRVEMTERIDAIHEQLLRYNNAYTQFSDECVKEFQRQCIENMQAIRNELQQYNQWYSDYLQDTKLYRAKKLDALTKQNSMLTEILLKQNQQLSTIFTLPEM